jgi:hypothetical protein
MRIPEENCNLILLVMVTVVAATIAGGATLLSPAPAPSAIDQKPVYVADRTSVRVVGAPFVPNTNPRER